MLAILLTLFVNGDLQEVTIHPFDFQLENKPETHVREAWATYYHDGRIVFIPQNEPVLLLINEASKDVVRIGKKGDGPGEFGIGNPRAISLQGDSMWVLDGRNRASLFVNGRFQTSFRVKSYQILANYRPKYGFAHNELFVVIPAFPASQALANVYDYEGNVVQRVGEIMPIDPEILQWNPAINNTIWKHFQGKWYCLMAYRPYIRIYNDQFKLEKEILVKGPEVDIFEKRFHELENDPNFPEIRPHFTDFQITPDYLYVVCQGVLYKLDHQGNVLSRTGFFPDDDLVKAIGWRPRIEFPHATVTEKGKVYLGTVGSYMDHDLWYADLP